jgi:pimeloyl-ACP methyl ester carboxylesterase
MGTKKPLRDVIVVLPGITGSVLRRDGEDVWAPSAHAVWSALTTRGESLTHLRLGGGGDPGDVVADRLMPDAHMVPGLVKIDGYSSLARLVRETFDVVPGPGGVPSNYLEFAYDWRLDNRVTAGALARTVQDALHRWQNFSQNPHARVIFLAHSMGGLVARYYLEVLDGWRSCRALITFGTPYRGSLNALDFLANGYRKLFVNLTEVMRSFPSVHQLLPIYRALQVDGEYVRVTETDDVPGIDPALARDALAFHREIEAKVTEHRSDDMYRRDGYALLPVVGTRQPTLQSARLVGSQLSVTADLPDWIDPLLADGDGTVPRASAIPLELSDAYHDTYVAERHSSLQRNAAVLADLRGRLEQSQVQGMREIRGPGVVPGAAERPAICLHVDDMYPASEPITMRAQVVNVASLQSLRARIDAVGGGASVPHHGGWRVVNFTRDDADADGWRMRLTGVTPGLYRVEVSTATAGPGAPLPVHDIFAVTGAPDAAGR